MNKGDFSKGFYLIVFVVAVIFLIVGFYFLPSSRYDTFLGTGNSMEPTLFDGNELTVDPKREPEQGDIIVFSCQTCPSISSDEILTKRLYDIDKNGCYWVLGDNQSNSFDSRDMGWLCYDDIKLYGVVIDIKKQ